MTLLFAILLIVIGVFIGSTGALGTVIFLDNRDKNRRILEKIVNRHAESYVENFGGDIEEAKEIVRKHLPR